MASSRKRKYDSTEDEDGDYLDYDMDDNGSANRGRVRKKSAKVLEMEEFEQEEKRHHRKSDGSKIARFTKSSPPAVVGTIGKKFKPKIASVSEISAHISAENLLIADMSPDMSLSEDMKSVVSLEPNLVDDHLLMTPSMADPRSSVIKLLLNMPGPGGAHPEMMDMSDTQPFVKDEPTPSPQETSPPMHVVLGHVKTEPEDVETDPIDYTTDIKQEVEDTSIQNIYEAQPSTEEVEYSTYVASLAPETETRNDASENKDNIIKQEPISSPTEKAVQFAPGFSLLNIHGSFSLAGASPASMENTKNATLLSILNAQQAAKASSDGIKHKKLHKKPKDKAKKIKGLLEDNLTKKHKKHHKHKHKSKLQALKAAMQGGLHPQLDMEGNLIIVENEKKKKKKVISTEKKRKVKGADAGLPAGASVMAHDDGDGDRGDGVKMVGNGYDVPLASDIAELAMKVKTSIEKSLTKRTPKRMREDKNGRMVEKKKRPPTAYTVFCNAHRNKLLAENPGLDFSQISRKLGEIWQSKSGKEKLAWKRLAKKAVAKGSTLISTGKAGGSRTGPPRAAPSVITGPVPVPVRIANATARGQKQVAVSIAPTEVTSLRAQATEPIDVAAHLKLVGESLSIIGMRLQEHKGLIAVQGSLSVLLDSLMCAVGPLMCITQQVPELNGCDIETHANTLDNVAYIMPGL